MVVLTGRDLTTYNDKKDLYVLGTDTVIKNLKLMDLVNLALENIPTSNNPTSN